MADSNNASSAAASGETNGFLRPKVIQPSSKPPTGCCHSKHTWNCCVATGVFGFIFLLLGIIVLTAGEGFLEAKILDSMALTEGSSRTESWLRPPVQPHLTGYAFHITNPDAVLQGKKPILEEKGPYVYKAVTVKDSDDNMVWADDESELTYRPRKVYTYDPELSGPGLDPDNDFVTVPNIPLWTGLNSLRGKSDFAKDLGRPLIVGTGRGAPFISVSFSGLLWGYEDDLPCLKLKPPKGCKTLEGDTPFAADDEEDVFGDSGDDWGDDWKRKKRSADEGEDALDAPEGSPYYGLAKPKAEFINCTCNW